MTKKPRDKKNLERKIVELSIKLHKRQTTKPHRRINLRKRIEFYKAQLEEVMASQPSVTLTESSVDVADAPTSITVE